MYAVEFQASIENGSVRIPEKYKNLCQNKKVKFIMMYESNDIEEKIDYNSWHDDELSQIGKIGLDSRSFVDDEEDYSKW